MVFLPGRVGTPCTAGLSFALLLLLLFASFIQNSNMTLQCDFEPCVQIDSNVSGGGNCKAISDGAGVSL
jgi:hypothetical protein